MWKSFAAMARCIALQAVTSKLTGQSTLNIVYAQHMNPNLFYSTYFLLLWNSDKKKYVFHTFHTELLGNIRISLNGH